MKCKVRRDKRGQEEARREKESVISDNRWKVFVKYKFYVTSQVFSSL